MAVLAVHRHEPLRLDDREERLDLLLLGVAGGVHVLDAGVHDLDAEAHEAVDHLADVHLVAGDRVRREDHGVAGAELEPAVLAVGHERQRRHRLALAAGGDHADLAVGEVADVLDVDDARSGMCSRPISRASRTFFFIDRPSVATVRPKAMAASAICWMRWMWLAKQAMTMRRPSCSWNRS